MAEKLIKNLRDKSKEHRHLNQLQIQWSFDEKLIPKALQNIATIFPHYSRHDASHSRQILINIERLLGDNVTSLTATDTWLLLEAAYWHDIGMIVTADDIDHDLKSIEFKQYLDDIVSQVDHELYDFATQFSSMNPQNCFSAAETPQQAVEGFRQLLAGWYRIHHSHRAANIIDDPWERSGISSPRNELVPKRLFRFLGQICRLHCSNFESLMESLPFCETGMATEDCHPRFVACLLRLGDLFDLDDNRFCPVMLRISGEIPDSSKIHLEKHLSIRHFRLDTDRVEITAQCGGSKAYETYEITDQWFRLIEDEFRNQILRWKDIAPIEYGSLPTLDNLKVDIAPPYEVIDPGQRPRFEVDPQKTMELLHGAGLYRDNWQSIRELMQNAVDATLIRIWLSYKGNSDFDGQINWDNPLSTDIISIFNKYPIQVNLYKQPKDENMEVQWIFEIKDNGIGISKQDLTFMKSVGGSTKNIVRRNIINQMPYWMRPSGAFGIGLQSAFMISSEVCFKTKSIITGESLIITMKSPIGGQRGTIFIQKNKEAIGIDYGTVLTLLLKNTDPIPQKVNFGKPNSYAEKTLADFDPICMHDIPYEAAKIIDEISFFSILSPFPINLYYNNEPILSESFKNLSTEKKSFYDPETGIILIAPEFKSDDDYISNISFRGQSIEKYRPTVPFAYFCADIVTESATEILTINRNDIKSRAKEYLYELLVLSLANYIENHQLITANNNLEEKYASYAFLYFHKNIFLKHKKQRIIKKMGNDEWKNIDLMEPNKTIDALCRKNNFRIYLTKSIHYQSEKTSEESFILREDKMFKHSYQLLQLHWKNNHGYVQQHSTESEKDSIIYFSKQELQPFDNNYLRKILIECTQKGFGRVGGRFCMPSWGKYKVLSSKISSLKWCRSISYVHPFQNHFVLPFFFSYNKNIVTIQGLERLCEWTKNNNISDKPIEVKQIHSVYTEFIHWIDEEIMGDLDQWKELRKN